jgi:hypothetical protein
MLILEVKPVCVDRGCWSCCSRPVGLMARKINNGPGTIKAQGGIIVLACAYLTERVTRIELALSTWE